MGIFSKQPADATYAQIKGAAIASYMQLIYFNPFAPAELLRQQWEAMAEQLEQAYKLSKKFSDTQADIPVLQFYMDDAKKRSQEYAHEIEYLKYKSEFNDLEKECVKLKHATSMDVTSAGVQSFERLYGRAYALYNAFQNFEHDNIDVDRVTGIYNEIAYRYCVCMGFYVLSTSSNGNDPSRDDKIEMGDKCIKIAKCFSENRYRVIMGTVQAEMGDLYISKAQEYSEESARHIFDKADDYRRKAIKTLSVLEEPDNKVLKTSADDTLEWIWMKSAFWMMFELYTQIYKQYEKAYILANNLIKGQDFNYRMNASTGMYSNVKDLVDNVNGELTRFSRSSILGTWQFT